MAETTIADKIPVSSLYPDRYGVGRSKVYEYLKTLGIQTVKPEGSRHSYLAWRDFEALDKYAALLQTAGDDEAIAFARQWQQLEPSTDTSTLTTATPVTLPPTLQLIIDAIAAQISPIPADPLLPQRQLESACDRGWLLSTTQLRSILGVKPRPGDRYGFRLTRVGRVGRESAWKVERLIT